MHFLPKTQALFLLAERVSIISKIFATTTRHGISKCEGKEYECDLTSKKK